MENYEIDGIHMDDYFYTYEATNQNMTQQLMQIIILIIYL